jgi:hypothetical protein
MAFPSDLEIEVAFNNDFDETTYGQSGWTSILPFVSSFDGDLRGREYERDQTESGSLAVTLDNSDSRFLPGSVQSPYYPFVKSDRRLRIRGKNMVHPNVARGGSRDHSLSGFLTAYGDTTKYTVNAYAMDSVRVITASGENAPAEAKEKANDGLVGTKWLTFANTGWLQYKFAIGVRMATYTVTSANDVTGRDPKNWALCGSNDGTTWTPIHTVTGESFPTRNETHTYTITSPNYYLYYRLNITLNNGDANTQLAEWELQYDSADDLLLPDTDLDWYTEVVLNQSLPTATYATLAWYVPLEYGVRLAHSAYVWRISGTEPTGLAYKLQVDYYDASWNVITLPVQVKDVVSTLPTSTTPATRAVSNTPPSTAKYAIAHFDVFIGGTTNSTPLVYGITGIQSELPANLAPDVSGFRDTNNWQLEGDGDGNYYNVGTDPTTSYLEVAWGQNDADLFITLPHLIPGEAYTATAEAKVINSQPSVQFTGNEGETGPVISSGTFTQYTCSFVAQQPEQELRWVLQKPVNPTFDFESGTTGWITSGCSLAANAVTVHGGTGSVLMTVSGSPTQALIRNSPGIAVTVGHSYTASVWVNKPVAANVSATIDWYTGASVYISSSTTTVAVLANTWTQITVTGTAPATAGLALIGPTIPSSPANGTLLYVDDVNFNDNTNGNIPGLQVRKLRVEIGDALTLSLPSSATTADNTVWLRPKDIFEGWVEAWPAVAGNTEMSITVVDRMKRLGDVELSNTLRESLFVDGPSLLLPLSDSMLDTPGRFSQLGVWSAEESGPTYVDISHSRGDLGVATYTTNTDDGPTGEASWKGTPVGTALSAVGYFFAIPYSKDYITPPAPVIGKPKPKPPPASTPTQKSTYTKKWYATWSRSYEGDDSTRFDDSPYMYQGSFDSSSPGNQKSLAGFDWKNIAATIKGADLLECYITIKNSHARWNKGLYAQVGTHNYISKPSTWNGATVVERRYGKKWVAEGGTLTINTGIQLAKEFGNGNSRGISIGPELTNDHDNYGYFYGASHSARPVITIKYRK